MATAGSSGKLPMLARTRTSSGFVNSKLTTSEKRLLKPGLSPQTSASAAEDSSDDDDDTFGFSMGIKVVEEVRLSSRAPSSSQEAPSAPAAAAEGGLRSFVFKGPAPLIKFLDEATSNGLLSRSDGTMSPKHKVTLELEKRKAAGVPEDALYFAFAYPLTPQSDGWFDAALNAPSLSLGARSFLVSGGFLYFDAYGKCIQVNAVSSEYGLESQLEFDGPHRASHEAVAQLRAAGRLQPVTWKQLRAAGALEFCWVHPWERFGAERVALAKYESTIPNGAFLYAHEDGHVTFYSLWPRDQQAAVSDDAAACDTPGIYRMSSRASSASGSSHAVSPEVAVRVASGAAGWARRSSGDASSGDGALGIVPRRNSNPNPNPDPDPHPHPHPGNAMGIVPRRAASRERPDRELRRKHSMMTAAFLEVRETHPHPHPNYDDGGLP